MKFKEIELEENINTLVDIEEIKVKLIEQKEKIKEQFTIFINQIQPTIKQAENIILTAIDSDPSTLEETMSICLSVSYTTNQYLNDTNTFLSIYDILNYQPKQKNLSELDRKKLINIKNVFVISTYNKLKIINDRLDKKISILQSVLKAEMLLLEKQTQ